MKKLSAVLVCVMALLIAAPSVYAQMTRKEQRKMEKAIKKEAKDLKKQGWIVAPGNLPLDMQLKDSYQKQMDKDENGYPKFVTGEAMTTGESYDAALFQATELAKLDLAGKISTEVTELIDTKLANHQLSEKQAASLVESVAASKTLVSQRLGRVLTPVVMHRDLKNGNIEVRTVIYYSHDLAQKAIKQAMREELEKKADDLSKQLDGRHQFYRFIINYLIAYLCLTGYILKIDGISSLSHVKRSCVAVFILAVIIENAIGNIRGFLHLDHHSSLA